MNLFNIWVSLSEMSDKNIDLFQDIQIIWDVPVYYNYNTHREFWWFRQEVNILSEDKVWGQFWVFGIEDNVPCKKKGLITLITIS